LNYSARTKDGRINIDALPASRDNDYCAVLLLLAQDPLAAADTNPEELRGVLDKSLPMFSEFVDDATLKAVAAKPVSTLPFFRYVGPQLHLGKSTLLIGDAVHTVKPYFGLGANSALEDVVQFSACLDQQADVESVGGAGVGAAIAQFSKERAGEAKALVQISRDFDRPGALGFLSFILPLILDGMFNGMAPKIFSPNSISMLQRPDLSFQKVREIKRRDRLLQVTAMAGALGATKLVLDVTLTFVPSRVTLAAFGVTAAILGVRKMGFFMTPNTSPADVIARTRQPIANNEDFLTKK